MIAQSGALLTDFYQLTMLEAYFRQGMNKTAVFDVFVRELPPTRKFLVAAGLDPLLDYLANLRFTEEELANFINIGRPAGDPANMTGVDMPPRGGNPSLTDQDIRDVSAYLKAQQ